MGKNMDPLAQRVYARFASGDGAPIHVQMHSTVAHDGKTVIKMVGDLSSDQAAAKAVSEVAPVAHALATQAKKAGDGDEYPVLLELDLLGVSAIGHAGVGMILGIFRQLHPHMPFLATAVIRAQRSSVGGVYNALATLGRLDSAAAKALGIEMQSS